MKKISEQSVYELELWIKENPGKFDGVIERQRELASRKRKDPLVAWDCVYLDGKCDCKSIKECKYDSDV